MKTKLCILPNPYFIFWGSRKRGEDAQGKRFHGDHYGSAGHMKDSMWILSLNRTHTQEHRKGMNTMRKRKSKCRGASEPCRQRSDDGQESSTQEGKGNSWSDSMDSIARCTSTCCRFAAKHISVTLPRNVVSTINLASPSSPSPHSISDLDPSSSR